MDRRIAFHILPAGPGDAGSLARVHVQSWRETYVGLLPDAALARMSAVEHARRWRRVLMADPPPETVLCVEGPSGVVGYCAGACVGDTAYVSTLYVLASNQGVGLGRTLLGSMARVLASRDAVRLRLWVLDGNEKARGFYAHLGGRRGEGRAVAGWGGDHRETAFDWPDIAVLASLVAPPPV